MLYHKIKILLTHKERPPYFTGAMLRGAFGYALKQVTCINPSYQCKNCFATENCLYYHFYEKENIFHPYRFDIVLDHKEYSFNFYLFGDSCIQLPYVLSALKLALTRHGVGKERVLFDEKAIRIDVNGTAVYQDGTFINIQTTHYQN
jgi:hypothetical protein